MPKKSELLTAYEQFYEQMKQNELLPVLQPFFDTVKAAEDAMAEIHRRDRFGRIPLLSAAKRDQLLRLHEALGREAEKLIAGERSSPRLARPTTATCAVTIPPSPAPCRSFWRTCGL